MISGNFLKLFYVAVLAAFFVDFGGFWLPKGALLESLFADFQLLHEKEGAEIAA